MGVQGSGPASRWKQDGFLQENLEGSWTVLRNFCWEMGSGLQGCPTGFHRDFRRFFPPTTVFSRSSPRLGVVSKAVLSGAVMTAANGDKSCCTCRNFPRGERSWMRGRRQLSHRMQPNRSCRQSRRMAAQQAIACAERSGNPWLDVKIS